MRKWNHDRKQATLEEAQGQLDRQLPAKVILYRYVESEGFKTIHIKELRASYGDGTEGADYICEKLAGDGTVMETTSYQTLAKALDHYNSI